MISASMVKELREATGAGMLDCKKALEETNGNMEEAITWLREKGISKAAKKLSRIAAEGLAYSKVEGNKAVIMDDDGIFWEDNGVSFSLIGRNVVNKNELLKIAESFK